MNTTYCRIFQFVMKIGSYFLNYQTPELIKGSGCVTKLPELIKKEGVSNPLVVCGPHISRNGLMDSFFDAMDRSGIQYSVFCDIKGNPTDENVEAGLAVFQQNRCDSIVAFGGGSPMDCAKAIAARNANPGKKVPQLHGLFKVHKKIVPLWAVPTTSGTGSETTIAAVITDIKTSRKASINDTVLMPKWAVLDPELPLSLSPFATATMGMDALCHAVEAYTNRTYCTNLEMQMARKAVKLIYDNLEQAYSDGTNIKARKNMQLAAFCAGRAFTRGCVGYVHACGHQISAVYDSSHSLVIAVLLPYVMRQYGPSVYTGLSALADVCGIKGEDECVKANRFIEWIEQANSRMGIPDRLDFIKEEDIPRMVKFADLEGNPLYPVPVIWKPVDFEALYHSVM